MNCHHNTELKQCPLCRREERIAQLQNENAALRCEMRRVLGDTQAWLRRTVDLLHVVARHIEHEACVRCESRYYESICQTPRSKSDDGTKSF